MHLLDDTNVISKFKNAEPNNSKGVTENITKQWLGENQEAINKYNQSIAKRGLFNHEWRRF